MVYPWKGFVRTQLHPISICMRRFCTGLSSPSWNKDHNELSGTTVEAEKIQTANEDIIFFLVSFYWLFFMSLRRMSANIYYSLPGEYSCILTSCRFPSNSFKKYMPLASQRLWTWYRNYWIIFWCRRLSTFSGPWNPWTHKFEWDKAIQKQRLLGQRTSQCRCVLDKSIYFPLSERSFQQII